jgi:hypothetical protein
MRALNVSLNGKKLCVAGVGDRGVLSAIVNWVSGRRGEDLFLQVGGLANEVHVDWVSQKTLRVGDEIRVRIVDTESADKPTQERRIHPAETLKAKKRYVRAIAKELGWKIQTGVAPRVNK